MTRKLTKISNQAEKKEEKRQLTLLRLEILQEWRQVIHIESSWWDVINL